MPIQIDGKYNNAIVFTNNLEVVAKKQIETLCDQEFTKDSKIRIMPDVHAGAGCTIGTTMTIKDSIVPNLVGVDIGCGMEVIQISNTHIEVQKLDKLIRNEIPSGFNVRDTPHSYESEVDFENLRCINEVNLDRAKRSIGSLGGGNHFIEVNEDDDGNLYVVVHSGSRHIGKEVAAYYQNEAYKRLNKYSKKDIDNLIKELKEKGAEKDIQKEIQKRKKETNCNIIKSLAYVEEDLFDDYINDMRIIQHFAELNRKAIMQVIIKGMKLKVISNFTTIHNYIDTESMILRKGAVSAKKDEVLIIPMNMRDGSIICVGKGNEAWNFSAPHGAGRLMSRTAAKAKFTVSEFKKSMKGIYSTSVGSKTLDEAPMAYKPMEEIIDAISDTVEIQKIIKPIYNFKAED